MYFTVHTDCRCFLLLLKTSGIAIFASLYFLNKMQLHPNATSGPRLHVYIKGQLEEIRVKK